MVQKKATLFFAIVFFCLSLQYVFAKEAIYTLPEEGDEPILSAIHQAGTSLELVMYTFTHKSIVQALIQAKKRGVKEYILLEKAPYKSERLNDDNLKRLTQAGIEVHFTPPYFKLTHQKSLIVDDRKAYILTNNFTYSGFNKQRNFIYVSDDKNIISEMKQVFFADYYQNPIKILSSKLVWSPDNSAVELLKLIRHARWSIDAYVSSINNPSIIQALKAAADKGIKVRMVLSKQERDRQRALVKQFLRSGIKVKEMRNVHAKAFIIDANYKSAKAYIGSQNLTSTSLYKNRELGTIIEEPYWVNYLTQVFSRDFHSKARQVKPNLN